MKPAARKCPLNSAFAYGRLWFRYTDVGYLVKMLNRCWSKVVLVDSYFRHHFTLSDEPAVSRLDTYGCRASV